MHKDVQVNCCGAVNYRLNDLVFIIKDLPSSQVPLETDEWFLVSRARPIIDIQRISVFATFVLFHFLRIGGERKFL